MIKKNKDTSSPLHPTTYLQTLLHLFESMQTLVRSQPTLCQYNPLDLKLAKDGIFDRPVLAREVQLLHELAVFKETLKGLKMLAKGRGNKGALLMNFAIVMDVLRMRIGEQNFKSEESKQRLLSGIRRSKISLTQQKLPEENEGEQCPNQQIRSENGIDNFEKGNKTPSGSRKYLLQNGRKNLSRPGTAFANKATSMSKLNSIGSTTFNTAHNTTSQTMNSTTLNTNSQTTHQTPSHTNHHTAVVSPARKFSNNNYLSPKSRINQPVTKKSGNAKNNTRNDKNQVKDVTAYRQSQRMSVKGAMPRSSIRKSRMLDLRNSSKFGVNEESDDQGISQRHWVRDGQAKMTQKLYHHRYREESLDLSQYGSAHESKQKKDDSPSSSGKHYFAGHHRKSSSNSIGDARDFFFANKRQGKTAFKRNRQRGKQSRASMQLGVDSVSRHQKKETGTKDASKRSSIPFPMPAPDDQALQAIKHLKKCIQQQSKESGVPTRVRLSQKDREALRALMRKKPAVSPYNPNKNIQTILEFKNKLQEKAMPQKELSQFYSQLADLRSNFKSGSPFFREKSTFFMQQGMAWEEQKRDFQRVLKERAAEGHTLQFGMICQVEKREDPVIDGWIGLKEPGSEKKELIDDDFVQVGV